MAGYETYQQRIARLFPDLEPGQVEAWMLLDFGTLDHLGTARFDAEAKVAALMVREAPAESAELAASYGLDRGRA